MSTETDLFQLAIAKLNKKYSDRLDYLHTLTEFRLREIANNPKQTFDLNRSQLIKYILSKEFSRR